MMKHDLDTAPEEGVRSFRSVRMGWTDPETGERLTVDMRGSGLRADALQPLGFEVLDGGGERGFLPAGTLSFVARLLRPRRSSA